MSQYSLERKESVLRQMVAPMRISMVQLAQETGISTWTRYHWRRQVIDKGEVVVGSTKHSGKWSASQKFAVVIETAAFNEAELAEYCRKKGLYPEQVKSWRELGEQAMASGVVSAKEWREALTAEKKRNKALERELRRKEKALAETAALLTLRKKAAAVWGEGEDE
jgi:hypothetical protein